MSLVNIFYHSADLDGHTSGAIARNYYEGNYEVNMHPINYGDTFPWDCLNDDGLKIVVMLDFSLVIEDMVKLSNMCDRKNIDFIWIDHHIGVIKLYNENIDKFSHDLSGIRESDNCAACKLAWKYFYKNDEVPRIISLISDYDIGYFLKDVIPTNEIFVPIKGYEGMYSISTCGRVRSDRSNIILKPGINGAKYLFVCLHNDGKCENKQIHSLVASNFLIKPENCHEVNHIDGNRLNNKLNNLEWTTRTLNSQHAVHIGLKPSASKYYGVSYMKSRNIYRARMSLDGERKFIGNYKDPYDAAIAYDNYILSKNLNVVPYYLPLNFEVSEKPDRLSVFYNPLAEPFHYGFSMEITDPKNNWSFWKKWFGITGSESEDAWIDQTVIRGKSIYTYELMHSANVIANYAFKTQWKNYNCLILNGNMDNANFITRSKEFEGCQVGIVYNCDKGERWTVSLRSLDNGPDVQKIAYACGGNGHAHASGFEWKDRKLPWEEE